MCLGIHYLCTQGEHALYEEDLRGLRAEFPQCEFVTGDRAAIHEDILPRIETVFGSPRIDLIGRMPGLRWLHLTSAGVDGYIDHAAFAGGGAMLSNSRGVYGLPISEHILALFLAMQRQLHLLRDSQWRRVWQMQMPTIDFAGSTVGVIGLGDIGSALARKCHALGCVVIGVKRELTAKPDDLRELVTLAELGRVLPQCDFVALCLPGTEETAGVLSREMLFAMKPGAYLVNIGRGSAVDQDALAEALQSGHLAAAGLDVTTPEPLPAEHILWKLPNCFITAHSSGRSPTNRVRTLRIYKENLRCYLRGTPMPNLIDIAKKY
jgi:phosphoglycerate dehydrogenase-like enzyme